MKIENKQIDELNAEVTLTIEKSDYMDAFNSELKTYQQKSQLKGFRKGKTPISVLRKMYGQSVMEQSVMKILSEKLDELIKGDDMDIIGEPFLVDRDNLPVIRHKSPEDYTYKFEVGLAPKFDIKGVSASDIYSQYEVDISDAMIDEEVSNMLKRLGEQKSVDDEVKKDDVVYFEGKELDDKGNIKDKGHECSFSAGYNSLTEANQKALKSKKKGDTIDVDIYEFEKDMTSEAVDKYLLGIDSEDTTIEINPELRLEITDVVRLELAKLDQDTFDKGFGEGNVKSEEEAREKIKGYLDGYFQAETAKVLNRQLMETIMSSNNIQLPEKHLKRWVEQEKETTIPDEESESLFKEMKWQLIKKKLSEKHKIEVTQEEVFHYFVNGMRQYSPHLDDKMLQQTAISLMEKQDQVRRASEEIHAEKLFEKIRGDIGIEKEAIDKEGFYKIVESLNQKVQ